MGLPSSISTDMVHRGTSFDISTSNHLLPQLSFLLTLHPSLYPGDEGALERNVCTGKVHICWGRIKIAERLCYVAFCPPFGGSFPLCIFSFALFPHLSFVSLFTVCLSLCPVLPALALPFPSQLFCLFLRSCCFFLVLGK